MKLISKKMSIIGAITFTVVASLLYGAYFLLFQKSKETSVEEVSLVKYLEIDDHSKREKYISNFDAIKLEDRRKLYESLLKGENVPFEYIDLLLDRGLVDTDIYIQTYTILTLRKYTISNAKDVSAYIKASSFRKEAILAFLDSVSGLKVSAFGVLAATLLDDKAIVSRLMNVMQKEKEGKLEMIRELGRHKNKHSAQIKQALVNVILEYQIGTSGAAPMLDAALILSRYESERPESIFPYLCAVYENELYESYTLLHVFENYGKSAVGCVSAMQRVIAKISSNEIKIHQSARAKSLIDKTLYVMEQIGGS